MQMQLNMQSIITMMLNRMMSCTPTTICISMNVDVDGRTQMSHKSSHELVKESQLEHRDIKLSWNMEYLFIASLMGFLKLNTESLF